MTEPNNKAGGHKTLAVKLQPGLHAQLELISGLEGIPMTTALVKAVELYVDTKRSEADFADRAAAAVAEAERAAAERRRAIQALLGQEAADVPGTTTPEDGPTKAARRRGTEPSA